MPKYNYIIELPSIWMIVSIILRTDQLKRSSSQVKMKANGPGYPNSPAPQQRWLYAGVTPPLLTIPAIVFRGI